MRGRWAASAGPERGRLDHPLRHRRPLAQGGRHSRRAGKVGLIFQHDADDAYVALIGTAMLREHASEVDRRWKNAYEAYFPSRPIGPNAAFIEVDVNRMELWIRGVTPEPFGLDATKLDETIAVSPGEREAMRKPPAGRRQRDARPIQARRTRLACIGRRAGLARRLNAADQAGVQELRMITARPIRPARSFRSASGRRSRPCGRSRHWARRADARSASPAGRRAR